MQNNRQTNRIDWVDLIKGLTMLVVIYEHTDALYRRVCMFLQPAAMPLYFVISGFTAGDPTKRTFPAYLRQKASRLLIPYFVYQIFLVAFHTGYRFLTTGNAEGILRHCVGILYGRYILFNTPSINDPTNIILLDAMNATLWFLPAMFFASLLYYLFFYAKNRMKAGGVAVIIGCVAVSAVCWFLPILLPWSLDTCGLLAVFMIAGYYIRKQESKLRPSVSAMCGILYLVLCYLNFGENTSVRKYGNPKLGVISMALYLLIGITAAVCIMGALKTLHEKNAGFSRLKPVKFVSWIGENSLTFMCIQFVPINLTHDLLANTVSNRFVLGAIQFFVALLACTAAAAILSRWKAKNHPAIVKYL